MSSQEPLVAKFKDCDKGRTGFILANGPSLKQYEFIPKDVPQIVVNEAALRVPWAKYACTMDSTVYKYMWNIQWQGKGALIPHIFTNRVTRDEESDLVISLDAISGYEYRFSLDPSKTVFNIDSPAYIALQLALYFGWKNTFMLGVDFCEDPNNGDTHYWGKKKGYWQKEDMNMEFQLDRAATIFSHKILDLKERGYSIYSCSPFSKLNCAAHYIPIEVAIEAL